VKTEFLLIGPNSFTLNNNIEITNHHTIMKLFQVLLLTINVIVGKLFTKVIQSPIFESNKICNYHHIVLLKETPFIEDNYEYSDTYAVDFSPTNDITDASMAWKMLLGKRVMGKIRMVYFDKIDYFSLVSSSLDKYMPCSIEQIKKIDQTIYCKINCWKQEFQLYNRNCQHFSRYLCT